MDYDPNLGYTWTQPIEKIPELHGEGFYRYECIHCEGETLVILIKNENKVTLPTIQFCPLCGLSNEYPKEDLEE